jgi:hypothetical protein
MKTMLAVKANEPEPRPDFLERHYTLTELARQWQVSRRTLRPWFINEPGVIRYGTGKLTKARQRSYVSLRIPESVARRVYRRRTGGEVYPSGACG